MLLNIFSYIAHLPMIWDFIIPLAIIFSFCAVLLWEGEYGKAVKKHFTLRRDKTIH